MMVNRTNVKIPPKVIAAIVATGIMSFCGVIVETAMNIAFPTLMREFKVSTDTVQWMTSIYLLVISIIMPLSAALKSSFKTKKLFLAANLLFFFGVVIDAVAPNFPIILLGRAIQGAGTGIALPLMFNIILEQVLRQKVGTMMGVGNLITGIAPAIGPTFGGIVVNSLGWRWVFYFLLPLIILSFFLGQWGITQKSPLHAQPIDFTSFISLAIFFAGMIYGFSNLSDAPFFSVSVAGSMSLACLALILFIKRSQKIPQAILQLELLRNRHFARHVLAFFFIQLISLGNAFLLPNFIQLVNDSSAMTAGLLVLPAGAFGAIMSPLGGRLLDKYGAQKPIRIGTSLMFLEQLIFALFLPEANNLLIAGVYIFYMAGMGMTLSSVMTAALEPLSPIDKTAGNAILNTAQQFAGAVGTSTCSAIVAFSQKQAGTKIGLPTAWGSQHAYYLLLLLNVIVILLLTRRTKAS